jgi:hypothetical protein
VTAEPSLKLSRGRGSGGVARRRQSTQLAGLTSALADPWRSTERAILVNEYFIFCLSMKYYFMHQGGV